MPCLLIQGEHLHREWELVLSTAATVTAPLWGSLLLLTYFWPLLQLSLLQLSQMRCFQQQKDVISTSVPSQVPLPFLTVLDGEPNPQARQDPQLTPIDPGQFRVSNKEPSPSCPHTPVLRSVRLTPMENSASASPCACARLSTRICPCSCLYVHGCARARGPCQHSEHTQSPCVECRGLGSCFPAPCPLQTSALTAHPLCPNLLTIHSYSVPGPNRRPAWASLCGAQSGCKTLTKERG